MKRGIVTLLTALALVLTTASLAQQTTIINHYLGNEPQDGEMMQYVLRNTEQHSVIINYYEPAGDGDEGRLAALVADALDFYIDRSVLFDGRTISLRSRPQVIHRDLEQIVRDAIRYYHFHDVHAFEGFSKKVTEKIHALNGQMVDEAWNPELMGSAAQDRRFMFVETKLNELKQMLRDEIGLFAGNNLLVRVDSREEQLKAEQDSLLAAVRGFKTNDPLAPVEIGFSTETLNLLAGDDPFILPTFTGDPDDDFGDSDLADRILKMLEDQNKKFDELKADVESLKREQERIDRERRSEDMRYMQEQIDLLRDLIMTIASDKVSGGSANAPTTAPSKTPVVSGTLPGGFDITFKTGSSQIELGERLRLNEVINLLATQTHLRILLTGYADATGNRETNLRLSKLRAQAVRTYLLKSGLPEHRILINFFGDEKAVGASNDRRVELRFIPRD